MTRERKSDLGLLKVDEFEIAICWIWRYNQNRGSSDRFANKPQHRPETNRIIGNKD